MTDSGQDIRMQFGKRVRALRRATSLSQEAFADSCGLDRTYIGGIERGERNVSLVNIAKIAAALNVPAMDLFEFGDE
jgi:transcriptional regulator with XRE-family HTH domain